jgi:hypothetical protein
MSGILYHIMRWNVDYGPVNVTMEPAADPACPLCA